MNTNTQNMAGAEDELLSFEDDVQKEFPASSGSGGAAWRVLIVDDDEDVHRATEFALRGVAILDRKIEFLHAYSSREAIDLLRRENDVAVILLDVVMESENAGLNAIGQIRGELGLANPRIILRTGQPGYAPEIETIRRYDINDYKTKNELTRSKLYTTLTAAIRSYDQLCRMDASRKGLEQIVEASNQLIREDGVREFSSGVIRQIAAFIGVEPEGMVCARAENGEPFEKSVVIAATGQFSGMIGHHLLEIKDLRITDSLLHCLSKKRHLVENAHMALFFSGRNAHDFAAFIDTGEPLRKIDEHLLEVFCTNISICADNVKLVEELRNLAYHDPVLKLPNRSYFVEAIDRTLSTAKTPQIVALIDVDQFSEINDMFGHHYGDLLLIAIARRLEQHFGSDALVARISNDTFGIFGGEGIVTPEKIHPFLNTSFDIEGVERPVSMAAGFVRTNPGDDGSTLLKDVSIAVKRAKENGQGQYAWYSPDVATATRERSRLLQDLRHAFKQELLFVVYQPQIDFASGKVVGVEALMRWRTPEGLFVSPERFIPVAEQSGLITSLGTWVLRTALHASRRIEEAGHPGLRMAVNVSTTQFRQPNFLKEVDCALSDFGVLPDVLELEITESVAVMGLNFVEDALKALRARGISVAIDDFGTGYSSLSYLGRLPANRLKIDHSFVWALDSGRSEVNIPEMVVPLGHQLNMKIIAEGVENENQANILKNLGCDEAQGFLYAQGMPLDELIVWLNQRQA